MSSKVTHQAHLLELFDMNIIEYRESLYYLSLVSWLGREEVVVVPK